LQLWRYIVIRSNGRAVTRRAKREEIIHMITEKFREMSTETIKFPHVVADVLGLHITHHKFLILSTVLEPCQLAILAQLAGLTTGSVTGIIDRLEKAGYVSC
jgi:DNA-binding MarR family transcriptional regulator